MIRALLIPALLLVSCAGNPPAPSTPIGMPPPPNVVQKAVGLREEGFRLLFSKDPEVKNPKLAYEKFLQASELGDPVSMDQLGGLHLTGTAGAEKSCVLALEWFEKSMNRGFPLAMNNMAYTLVSCPDKSLRDGEKAESLMKALLQTSPAFLAFLDTYAAVLAEQGQFPQAVKTMDVVIDIAELTDANPERIDEMKKIRGLFQKKRKLEKSHEAEIHL